MPRQVRSHKLYGDREPPQCRGMLNLTDLAPPRRESRHPSRQGTPAHAPSHFVTTMLDASVDLRDVHIVGGHADPRTTMRYDGEGPQQSGPPSELHPGRLHGVRDVTLT